MGKEALRQKCLLDTSQTQIVAEWTSGDLHWLLAGKQLILEVSRCPLDGATVAEIFISCLSPS